jgi:DNA-binding CsgD family transcriptional regulator
MREPEAMTPLLTPRRAQILICIGEGMTNREIGQRLGLAEQTIKNSVTLILAALDVTRRAHAAIYAANARDGRLGQIQRQERRSLPVPHGRCVNSVGSPLR